MKKLRNILGSTLTVALLGSIMAGCADNNAANNTQNGKENNVPASQQTTATVEVQPSQQTTGTETTNVSYKDGSYTATGSYGTPGGVEDLKVTVTLKDGKITEASFAGTPKGPISKKLQDKFNEGFKEMVVGKPVNGLALGVVNGSSLTPKGFMDALEKIKSEAAKA